MQMLTRYVLGMACLFFWANLRGADPARREIQASSVEQATSTRELAASCRELPSSGEDACSVLLTVTPFEQNDRSPVTGKVLIKWGDLVETHEVKEEDYSQGSLTFLLPDTAKRAVIDIRFETPSGETLHHSLVPSSRTPKSRRDYVEKCLSTLIAHGRDEYGPEKSPLFMAILDAETQRSPRDPMELGSLVRLEDRIHRRAERGSNLWYDQALLQCLFQMSVLTGNDRFARAADEYVDYFFRHCHKPVDPSITYLNGMPTWGTHIFWDCYADKPGGDEDGNGPHEILAFRADWENMYRRNPDAVRRAIDAIWEFHIVDKGTGLSNRHDDRKPGCDFAFSSSSFAQAMAFMYQKTGEERYLRQAKTIVDWHWDNRNLDTNLTADTPGRTNRYDGHHCFTTVAGPHALGVLRCYELTGDPHFRDVAFAYIKAYDRYAWSERDQTYWAMLKLDGTPVPEQPRGRGYDAFAPYGPVDVWRSTIYSYEFTLAAAQAAVAAYEVSQRDGSPDGDLLKIARRWGSVVERSLPPKVGRRWKQDLEAALPLAAKIEGAYAEDYGRAISLFVHLHRASDDPHYLELANSIADEAIAKLFRNGVFVGHPAKPYYECTDGVGILMLSLLELDGSEGPAGGAW
jgi:hypothetical protein